MLSEKQKESLHQRLYQLMLGERRLETAPFAAVIEFHHAGVLAATDLDPEQILYLARIVEQWLVSSAMKHQQPRDVLEARWLSALDCGFDDDGQRANLGCNMAAYCLRMGWHDLGLRALDDLIHVTSEQPEPLRENVRSLREALTSAKARSGTTGSSAP